MVALSCAAKVRRGAKRHRPRCPCGAPGQPLTGDDGSVMLAAYEGWHADSYWLTFGCEGEHGCQRRVALGFRPAIARFGRGMTIRGIPRRLRWPRAVA